MQATVLFLTMTVSTMRAAIAFFVSSFALTAVSPVVAEEVYKVGGMSLRLN